MLQPEVNHKQEPNQSDSETDNKLIFLRILLAPNRQLEAAQDSDGSLEAPVNNVSQAKTRSRCNAGN